MRRKAVLRGVLAAAIGSAILAACGGGGGSAGDKAGGAASTVTLRFGTMEKQGAPYTEGVEEFARQVETLSGGSVRVKIVWDAAVEYFGEFGPGADQKVAGLVKDGKLDMALIPARAWDELGVTSLQALQAPFLISNDDLVGQVVKSKLSGDMLAGMDKAGVVGLALLPEGLRHPVGFQKPFLTLGDFTGAEVRALPSNASNRLLEALGAKPVDVGGDDFLAGIASGEIVGAESGFAWAGSLPRPGTMTVNITFFPKVNAVAANAHAFERLSQTQQEAVREAAASALSHVLATNPTEAERAQDYCGMGGRIAFASDGELAKMENAAQPVYSTLEGDPLTKSFIEQIQVMKASASNAPAATVATCPSTAASPAPTGGGSSPTAFPEGTYRAELPADFLISHGLSEFDANQESGITTITIKAGQWLWHKTNPSAPVDCMGSYTIESGRISLVHDTTQCGDVAGSVILIAGWRLEGSELRFLDVRSGLGIDPYAEALWGSKPWKKIA